MWENAYLSIKKPKASRARLRALDPGGRLLASLMQLHFATSATFGFRSWGLPLNKSWIRTCLPTTFHELSHVDVRKWKLSASVFSKYENRLH